MTREPRDAPEASPHGTVAMSLSDGQRRTQGLHPFHRPARGSLDDTLTQSGFRRSQTIAYRPACENCRACVSVRVKADEFVVSEFSADCSNSTRCHGDRHSGRADVAQYSLFRRYLDARHTDGGMADMTVLDYSMMVDDTHVETRLVEYRFLRDTAVAQRPIRRRLPHRCPRRRLVDGLFVLRAGRSRDRSFGTYMILDHIDRARRLGLPHLYLGYWVEGSRKMDYKARFLPQERLGMNGWERVE